MLFEAIGGSTVSAAVRMLTDGVGYDGREPNIVLVDESTDKFHDPMLKAFRALDDCAWGRRPLHEAKGFYDWEPAVSRRAPDVPE